MLKRKSRYGLLVTATALASLLLVPGMASAEEISEPVPEVLQPSELVQVEATENGYTVWFTEEAIAQAEAQGASTDQIEAMQLPACVGDYYLRKVSNWLEWGTQNVCSPEIPKGYAPMSVTAKLLDSCNGPFCIAFQQKAGPISSGYTYNRVATTNTSTTCNNSEKRRYRVAVDLRYNNGSVLWNLQSGIYYDIPCHIF